MEQLKIKAESLQSCVSVSVTDLRIGNYYSYDDDTIKLDGSLLATYLQNDCDLYLYPIILNSDWLLKLGFAVTHYAYLRFHINLLETEIYLRPSLEKWYWGFVQDGIDCEINDCYELSFVHELQDLVVALTKVVLTEH
jgi:hypothetical protein